MWVLEKLRDSVFLDSSPFRDATSPRLHHNILTPEKIPEFCLPPRLCKDIPAFLLPPDHEPDPPPKPNRAPSALYERPNTRRKESLFHSRRPVYVFKRSPATPPAPPSPRRTVRHSGSTSSLSESPSSSRDSSPFGSPCTPEPLGRSGVSCPALAQTVRRSPSGLCPAPPLFPLDSLQCQGRLPREHVLPLEGRGGAVRFSIELYDHPPRPCLATVRLRVVSVEGTGGGSLSCALRLCLMPGRRQRQKSATIRQSGDTYRFNEDFFFTELGEVDGVQVRIKVVDKVGGARLRRGTHVGEVTRQLSLLLA